jgi:molybdopterin/thiamine biosynthesis adenylyltransferase
MSTELFDAFRKPAMVDPRVFEAPGLPPLAHPAEPDAFARQVDVPAHDQRALENARILIAGAGGLGSWTALALVRAGARHITIVEPDRFDRTNASRQLMFGGDLGQSKAIAVAKNLVPHAMSPARIMAIPLEFQEAVNRFAIPADIALFLVDNNACRMAGARFARESGIPAVFAMLSADAMRTHVFLQGPHLHDACIRCALPNLDPEGSMPCVSAIITSCFLAAAYITFFVHRALMEWPEGAKPFNWREADLLGVAPDRTGMVLKRQECPTCSTW